MNSWIALRKSKNDALVVGLIALITLLPISIHAYPIVSGDSIALIDGAHTLIKCVNENVWRECANLGPVPQFAAGSYLTVIPLLIGNLPDDQILKLLAIESLLAFVVILICVKVLVTNQKLCVICIVGLGLGAPLVYSSWTFSESVSASLLSLAIVIAICMPNRVSLLIMATASAASMKNQAFSYVVPFVTAAYVIGTAKAHQRINWQKIFLIITSGMLGAFATMGLNFWRYGTFVNVVHANPLLRVTEPEYVAKYFLASFISPNGGVLITTPVLLFLLFILAHSAFGLRKDYRTLVATLIASLGLMIQAITLALWYSPFGWVAWGDRLILPAVVGFVLITTVIVQQTLSDSCVSRRFLNVSAALVAISISVAGASNIGFLLNPQQNLGKFFIDGPCNIAISDTNKEMYMDCMNQGLWRLHQNQFLIGLESFVNQLHVWEFFLAAVVVLVSVGLLSNLKSEKTYEIFK